MLATLVLGLVLSVSSQGSADSSASLRADYESARSKQLTAVAKTQGLLADKYEVREAEVKRRTRALYKLTRSSWSRLWLEPTARKRVARWLGAARRIARRDQRELALLRLEITSANLAQQTLENAVLAKTPEAPSAGSLLWPVQGSVVARFGDYKGPTRKVVLRRRGIEIRSKRGNPVLSVAAGHVRYVGPISGLGQGMIIEHEGFISVLGHLNAAVVRPGDTVSSGQIVSAAAGKRVYLEIRVTIGNLGHPIDPVPLLGTRPS